MHYIRLLRPPDLSSSKGQHSLKLVLTITTDLSDSFLLPDEPVQLLVILEKRKSDGHADSESVVLTSGSSVAGKRPPTVWKAGMRVLKLELPLPRPFVPTGPESDSQIRVLITPANRQLSVLDTRDITADESGRILPVSVELPSPGEGARHVCIRSVDITARKGKVRTTLEVEEDLGESIARHVWDGGLVAVCLLADVCLSPSETCENPLPILQGMLIGDEPINILEVGSGVGTLGLGLASILPACSQNGPRNISLLLTDLPDAEERACSNIRLYHASSARGEKAVGSRISVEYENLDWEDGRVGKFGPKAQSRRWDLLVLSDCTYNTDTLLFLVQTLSALYENSRLHFPDPNSATKVLLATKQRHESEKAVFDLMRKNGWKMVESTVLPLPVLGTESQSIEVYVFEKS